MRKALPLLIPIVLILTMGIGGYMFGLRRTVTILLNGQAQMITTRALTVDGVLSGSGIFINPQDHVQPERGSLVGWNSTIVIEQARPVTVWNDSTGKAISFQSPERAPIRLLQQAGINPAPNDQILWNSMPVALTDPLSAAPSYFLQYKPTKTIHLKENEQERTIQTTATTLLRALWDEGVQITSSDSLSVPMDAPLHTEQKVILRRAISLTVQIGEQQLVSRSAAETIGQALADAGVALQALDYSIPAGDQPIPGDGNIRVIRVREEVILEQTTLPFEQEFVADPDLELDQTRLVRAGHYGVQVTRLRVRYEDGKEVSRTTEAQWTASEPQPEQIGYGTKVVIRNLQTPEGTIEYWRAVPVYATSYSPCRSGGSRCYYGTASGLPVRRGVIGVTSKWYRLMAGQRVYVPGYGSAVIGDVGGGIPGQYWIDLAFSDEDFEPWHQNTILYFLTPVPADIPWILP